MDHRKQDQHSAFRPTTDSEAGRDLQPGETPPLEGGLSESGPDDRRYNPPKGWSKGPLIIISAVVLLFAVFMVVRAAALWD